MTPVLLTHERIELARDFIKQWRGLERQQCTSVEWLQLKFSITARQARVLHDAALAGGATLRAKAPKRGYSRAFTPHGDSGKKYLLDDIPAGLWKDVKAKSKRTGISIRAQLLQQLTAWVAEPE